ncbi:MAG: hypothetical protein DRP15_01305 [Candidatus Aenigmatarchaeota archaeon]|nr:MAG: hypothetical protein DRP15_01305 [Candidatus Aenigmarchaeota archaeon]
MFNRHVKFFHYLPFLKRQINELYLIHSIEGLVFSLIAVFIPIYLLKLGYTLSDVLVFYIIRYAVVPLFSLIVGHISTRFGIKHTLLMRFPMVLVYLIMLYSLQNVSIPLILIAIIDGFQSSLYWIPLHSLFARSTNEERMGSDVSKLYSFPRLASIAAPFIGGFIITLFGFGILFAISMALLIGSLLPLFSTPEIKPHVNFKIKEGIGILKKYRKYFFSICIYNISSATEYIVWPVFTYFVLASTVSVGIVGTLLSFGVVLFTLAIGRFSDRFDKNEIIKIGAIFMFLVWWFRAFLVSETFIYLLTILAGFFSLLVSIPLTAMTYELAKKSNIDEFIVFREIPVSSGKIISFITCLILIKYIEYTFLATGLFQLLLVI